MLMAASLEKGFVVIGTWRLHIMEDQVTTGSRIFFAFFMFQLDVNDSLHLQALAFSQVPSEIALIGQNHIW